MKIRSAIVGQNGKQIESRERMWWRTNGFQNVYDDFTGIVLLNWTINGKWVIPYKRKSLHQSTFLTKDLIFLLKSKRERMMNSKYIGPTSSLIWVEIQKVATHNFWT